MALGKVNKNRDFLQIQAGIPGKISRRKRRGGDFQSLLSPGIPGAAGEQDVDKIPHVFHGISIPAEDRSLGKDWDWNI